jgi:hypothetical protein
MADAARRVLELQGLKRKELNEIGDKHGLRLWGKKHLKKRDCAERIVQAEIKAETTPTATPKPQQPTEPRPAKPDFEAAASGVTPKPENRGGAREGAGRKPGQTGPIVRMQSLPEQPNPAVKDTLEMLFESWAVWAKEPKIALSKTEAFDLALPYTQILHYLGYNDRIPPWAVMAITAVWTTWNIVKARLALTVKARPELFSGKGVIARVAGVKPEPKPEPEKGPSGDLSNPSNDYR